MDFRILGPLEVRDEGRAVALGGSRPRALLALLLLHANEVLTAERMIDGLWGETAPSTASSMLHVQVSRLRKALPEGAARLVTRERGYVLLLDLDELDAHRFEDLVGVGGRELAAGRPAAAAEVLDRALALWRGAPLGDLGYEAFAQAEVARLQELHAAAHELMIDAQLALGHHAEVIGPLHALIGEHPYRERLRGQLMLALYRCDRQADALQAYHDARRLLVDELGIEPGVRLRDLERAVLEHDPALALEAPAPAPMPAPAPAPTSRGDARRLVTVVVAELSDAGALAERIDPESLHAVLERFAVACTSVLERHGAEADAGAGDVVVGVFGSGIRHEDDPLRAVRAALELRERWAALAAELECEVGSRPEVAIGVSSGEVFSHPGARPRGKPMHVALALAGAARDGEVLVGDDTRRLAGGAVESETAEPVAIRGRSAAVSAFRLLGMSVPDHTPRGPFVARRAELGELHAAVRRARAERACRRVTVVGPPGIGKSRLARELIRTLEGDALVTVGRCRAYGDGTTSGPLAELVTGITGDDPAAWLAERLAGDDRAEVIAGRVLAALGLSDVAAQTGETAWAVRRVLEASARERPLVAVIDDAHWAEPELLDLLEYTLAFSGGAPILLLCLARPELLELRSSWAAPQPDSTLLALDPLDTAAAHALLAAQTDDLDAATAARIVDVAEGNPLFLEQLLAVRAEGDASALPPSIEAVLAARIDALDRDEREVLVHASLEGRRFHAGAVAELLPTEQRAAIDAALLRLVRKQLIRPDRPDFPGEDGFRFAHALIRDAAYAGMPKRLRGELHERLADWLRVRPHVADEAIGFHLECAIALRAELGPLDQHDRALAGEAADRLAIAARAALLRGDAGAAGRLLERALALVPDADPARAELLVELGAAFVDAGRLEEAERRLAEAVDLARRDGDPRLAARARVELELGRQHAGGGDGEAIAVAQGALAELERHGDEYGRARAWRLRAWIEWTASRAAAADEAWRRAAAHARAVGDERELFELLGWRASAAAFGPLPVPQAIARCEEFRAQAGGRPVAVALILHPLGTLHAMAGDFDRARALVMEGNAIFAELGRMDQAVSHHEALIEALAGHADRAETLLRRGYETLERMGERNVLGTTAALLARIVVDRGSPAEAVELCTASERFAAPDDLVTQAMWRAVRARILGSQGDTAGAMALARAAMKLVAAIDLVNDRADVVLDAADAFRLAGDAAEAGRITRQAIALYEGKGNLVSAARALSRPPAGAPV